ncbi:MAG: hypothetical protein ABW171_12145 [Steroidobacter sp.]
MLVRGAAVTIVLRDASIEEDVALHGAFETARELAGQRSALHELTVNGRTLYRRSEPGVSHPSPTIAFSC